MPCVPVILLLCIHPRGMKTWFPQKGICCSHAFWGKKLTQKDNEDSGVQFITPAGPGQSLLLAKDPNQFL